MATLTNKTADALVLIEYWIRAYDPGKVCVACSFGKDSIVAVDLARRIRPEIPVVCVLSDTEFEATERFVTQASADWNLKIHRFNNSGKPEECCGPPKVETMKKALEPYEAWITGVRNTEGITRHRFQAVSMGPLTKVNPLRDWSEADVWRYTALRRLEVSPLYWTFRSLGCEKCSSPEEDGESERAGRWRGMDKEECGIHTEKMR